MWGSRKRDGIQWKIERRWTEVFGGLSSFKKNTTQKSLTLSKEIDEQGGKEGRGYTRKRGNEGAQHVGIRLKRGGAKRKSQERVVRTLESVGRCSPEK